MTDDLPAPRLGGPGAVPVRAAIAAIRRMAAAPPPSESFGGWLPTSQVPVGDGTRVEPRRLITPGHLMTSPPPVPADEAMTVAQLVRVREAISTLKQSLRVTGGDVLATGAAPGNGGRAANRLARSAIDESVAALAASPDGSTPGSSQDGAQDATQDDVLARAMTLLGGPLPQSSLSGGPIVPGSAFHDFAEYQFIQDPWSSLGTGTPSPSSPATLEQFLSKAHEIISHAVWAYCQMDQDTGPYTSISFTPYFPGFIETIYRLFLRFVAEDLFELQAALILPYTHSSRVPMDDVLAAFDHWVCDLCNRTAYNRNSIQTSFDNPDRWVNASREILAVFDRLFPNAEPSVFLPEESQETYGFTPYPGGVNFGLRVIYRQEWLPLGNQPGEIVRTVPLGPKQSEKVTVKTVITRKATQSSEELTSTETTTESSTATKDSREVVDQASSSFKWHVDTEASGGFGPVSAKLSAGLGGEQASSSKDTKAHLSETMAKTASRMKRDTKIVVTTETSQVDENSRMSEIVNPNDEIAITYVYSKLQRAYELTTQLAEVNSVVFVPEPVPHPAAITTGWVQRHATVLAKVLLDPVYSAQLAAIVAEPDDMDLPDDEGVFKAAATTASEATKDYKNFPGGYMPDLLASGQEAYARAVEAKRADAAEKKRREHGRAGLLAHIRRHILHYMRAVWSDEDADQRWLRFSRITVPTRWVFVPDGSPRVGYPVNGRFVADYSTESLRPLTDIINPAGPVGYAGNYAVFLLRGSTRLANMHEALAALRSQYARFAVTVQPPASLVCINSVAHEPHYAFATYTLKYGAQGWAARLTAVGTSVCDEPIPTQVVGDGIDFDGLRVWLDGVPAAGDAVSVVVQVTGELADPELRLLPLTDPLPPRAREPAFFTADLLREMARRLPVVAVALGVWNTWEQLDEQARDVARGHYHQFLMMRGATRRTVLDTNNVVLDLDVGDTPALEDFKRLHRYLDVLKELEERHRRRLENQRLGQRLSKGILGDPDIERMTVVAGDAALADLMGGDDGAATDPHEAPPGSAPTANPRGNSRSGADANA